MQKDWNTIYFNHWSNISRTTKLGKNATMSVIIGNYTRLRNEVVTEIWNKKKENYYNKVKEAGIEPKKYLRY